MGYRDLVNKFTAGELDPKFFAEVDYDGYRKAARKLRNVMSIPQGGATRRFGSTYEQTINDGVAPITNIDHVRLIEYEHANNELYDIIIRSDIANQVAFDVYLGGVAQVTVPAPAATYTMADIRNIRWVKDYDRLILLLSTVRPYEFRRITANNWQLIPITFQWFPTYDFTGSDNPATLPTPNTPYTSVGVTFTPNATAATTLTASIAVYTANHVGGLYYGNGGIFRITAVDATQMIATGFTLEEFVDTSAIQGDLSELLERAWNDGAAIGDAPPGIARLWPTHGTFYQSRLVLGGSPSLPGTAFASVVRRYYDFDDSTSDPSDSWGVEVGVTGNDVINDILATKSLVLISNKGPASTSILLDSPTTPSNAFLNTQGTEGSRNMDSIIIDNQVMYADRAGNTIWTMSYELPDTGYNIANASILSTQLIRNPRWADIFDPDDLDGRYYLLVNGDGSMAIYNSLKDENIHAWTLAQTTGSYIDVGCTANQAKTLVRRKINTGIISGGNIDAAYTVDDSFGAFRNVTPSILAASGTSIFVTQGDYILIGNEIEFQQITLTFNAFASVSVQPTYEILNDTGDWQAFTPSSDTTNGFRVNGTITWTNALTSNWKSQTIVGTDLSFGELVPYYWLRIKRTVATLVITPIINTLLINTDNRIYLEKLGFNAITTFEPTGTGLYMDCQLTTTSDATGIVTGLSQLAGQNVYIFANGFPMGTFFVSSLGMVTIPVKDADVDVGLDYIVNITPMPIVALLANGYSVYEPAHVDYLYIDYYLSLGITIQGQNIPQVVPGGFMTVETPQPTSGYYKVPSYNGWNARADFVISQSYPAPLTILGVSFTVEVSP